MTELHGTNVAAGVIPFTDADVYPTHFSVYGKGGWHEVSTISERDAIPTARRAVGMAVSVLENGKVYILKEDGWEEIPIVANLADVAFSGNYQDLTNTPDVYTKTEIDNKLTSAYIYKGTVASYENLPTDGLTAGDVYNVVDTGANYAWTGTEWDKLSETISLESVGSSLEYSGSTLTLKNPKGTELSSVTIESSSPAVDDSTIHLNESSQLEVIGSKTVNNIVKADWIGTYEEYQAAKEAGIITSTTVCIVTDDEETVDYYTKDEVDGLLSTALRFVPITYAELKALRDAGNLTAGTSYRITDYVTTTRGVSANLSEPSRSAGHQFDVIIEAIGPSEFAEVASCALHEGDTYFADQNISSWQIWYSIDNDVTKYYWADETNGKGVIYRMIDDKRNDLPYDFKNIQFYRDKSLSKYANSHLASRFVAADGFYYTFSDVTGGVITDFSLADNDNNGNVMDICNKNSDNYAQNLNNNVFLQLDGSRAVLSNTFGINCMNNTMGQTMYSKFGSMCYNNVLHDCGYNTIGNSFYNNTGGQSFGYNFIVSRFYNNAFNHGFTGNYVNDGFLNNTIGNGFAYNSVGPAVQYLTTGAYFYYNELKGNNFYVKTPAATNASRFSGIILHASVSGSSSTNLLDLTALETGTKYPREIKKDANEQVLITWNVGNATTGKYKTSITATDWLDLASTLEVENWES